MKLPKELYNGIIIWIGISIYFLSMKALDLADLFYLRALNILFIYYGANRMLKVIIKKEKLSFLLMLSLHLPPLYWCVFSIAGLVSYSYIQGGDKYIESLSASFFIWWRPNCCNLWCFFTLKVLYLQ
jgi:hypothetical protein